MELPDDLAAALAQYEGARANYEDFSNTKKQGVLLWVKQAKRQTTRADRIAKVAAAASRGGTPFYYLQASPRGAAFTSGTMACFLSPSERSERPAPRVGLEEEYRPQGRGRRRRGRGGTVQATSPFGWRWLGVAPSKAEGGFPAVMA